MIINEYNSLTNLDEYISLKGKLTNFKKRLEYEKEIEDLIVHMSTDVPIETQDNKQNKINEYAQAKNKLELRRLERAIERYTKLTEYRKDSITPREIEQSVLNDFNRHRKENNENYSIMEWEEKFFIISDSQLREALASFIKSVEDSTKSE